MFYVQAVHKKWVQKRWKIFLDFFGCWLPSGLTFQCRDEAKVYCQVWKQSLYFVQRTEIKSQVLYIWRTGQKKENKGFWILICDVLRHAHKSRRGHLLSTYIPMEGVQTNCSDNLGVFSWNTVCQILQIWLIPSWHLLFSMIYQLKQLLKNNWNVKQTNLWMFCNCICFWAL